MRLRLHRFLVAMLAFTASLSAYAQDGAGDSLVTLVSARSAQLIEKDGVSYRKVIGPARFLHNDTYLLCDTALWNVNTNIIDAIGNVQIIQDQTRLRSETLQYVADDDLAKFRGALVELEDKDRNTLRTRYLDYNTKDSVAIFQNGASMKDKDGQIIESQYGSYDSKAKLFVFNDRVNMFTDSIFIKTSRLEYRSDLNTAYFGYGTDMWESDNMLSANDGWYDRDRELFFFRRNVHIMTRDQEAWSDTLYYRRDINDVEMLGRVELMDTTRSVFALAGRFEYSDSLSKVRMTRDPAVMSVSEEGEKRDTVSLGGDVLIWQTIPKCDVDSMWVVDAGKRLQDLEGDPVTEYRRKAAEAARKAAEEAARNDPNRPQEGGGAPRRGPSARKSEPPTGEAESSSGPSESSSGPSEPEDAPVTQVPDSLSARGDTPVFPRDSLTAPVDSLSARTDSLASSALPSASHRDSLAVPADSLSALKDSLSIPGDGLSVPADSLTVPTDSLTVPSDTLSVPVVEEPKDTTKISFIWATGKVKLFREDMQMSCDSLAYSDLDSLVRLYRDPLIFNEGNRQYAADSIFVVIRDREARRAHLMSDAFITIQEDTLLNAYDQIRGTEMVAYFDSTRALTRFDALGGASALFFLQENDALATVNKVESKMLYALFKEGSIDRLYYFEEPKNDAFPVVQLPKEDRMLKGFRWDPDRRPTGRKDITPLEPRMSQRTAYLARPHAEFKETDFYFPGYIGGVYKEIAYRDSMSVVRARERKETPPDTLSALPDSLGLEVPADSLGMPPVDSLGVTADSLGVQLDSTALAAVRDSLAVQSGEPLSPEQLKALEKQRKEEEKRRKAEEKARIKAEKQAAREAKWAEEDRRYEEKQAAKAQKKLEKERARKLRALRRLERKAQKERALFEKYLEKERRKQSRQ